MKKGVAYYRVSTDKQGIKGLGMEAQREIVENFAHREGYEIEQVFVEVESGKKRKRPQLNAALELCERIGATLIIAKLDRLARDTYFVLGIMERKVEFKAVDMPHANKLMLTIHAAFAEYEREMISTRTKAALDALKRQGAELGPPKGGWTVQKQAALDFAKGIRPTIRSLMDEGCNSSRKIAARLNDLQAPTPSGNGTWHQTTVRRISAYLDLAEQPNPSCSIPS